MSKKDNKELYTHEQVLKFVKYNNRNKDYCAFIPNNHVIITDKNKKHKTINKVNLNIGSNISDVLLIGDTEYFCELLNREKDDKVLLSIQYYDDPDNRLVYENQKQKLVKFVEGNLILGFKQLTDYRDHPQDFYNYQKTKIDNSNDWVGDGAW
jgi:hypothetical protein